MGIGFSGAKREKVFLVSILGWMKGLGIHLEEINEVSREHDARDIFSLFLTCRGRHFWLEMNGEQDTLK